jgi:hypothetical protein
MRDAGLKEAARLLLFDLEKIDGNLTRARGRRSPNTSSARPLVDARGEG